MEPIAAPEFEVCDVPGDPAFAPGRPDWAGVDLPALTRTFRLFPHRLRGEGHFAAVLRKTDGTAETPALMPTEPASPCATIRARA